MHSVHFCSLARVFLYLYTYICFIFRSCWLTPQQQQQQLVRSASFLLLLLLILFVQSIKIKFSFWIRMCRSVYVNAINNTHHIANSLQRRRKYAWKWKSKIKFKKKKNTHTHEKKNKSRKDEQIFKCRADFASGRDYH